MKIVLTRSMLPGDIQYIKEGLDKEIAGQYELVIPSEYTEDGICAVASNADILLGPYVTKKILETAKHIKLIQVPWAGMDTFDFDSVKGCTVPICNTHSNADSVAEIGVAMILDLLKKISYHDRKMRLGNWNRDQKPLNMKSKMLNQQTVCILGFGNIGSRIGKLTTAFGAKVIAVGGDTKAREIAAEVYKKDQIKDAISKADVIVCTIPLTDATRSMINSEMFNCMKEGVVFLNLSRAAIIDEDAVWDALISGKLGAFGSDVWWNAPRRGETESYPSLKHEFWKLDNVLMSPHRAGFIENSLPHLDGAIDNIIALTKGKELTGIVNINKRF